MKKIIKIAGIDPSINNLGFVSKRRQIVIRSGVLRGFERIQAMFKNVTRCLRHDNITFLVLEGHSFGSRGSGIHTTIEFIGLIKYWCRLHDVKVLIIPPRMLQKFVMGKSPRKTAKELAIKAVHKKWGFPTVNSDIADAYGLWKLGRMFLKIEKPIYIYEKDILVKVKEGPNWYE